jgi:hypothetical protein
MPPRKAAIDVDALMDRPLTELNAGEFLQALSDPTIARDAVLIADKKKVELWVEENVIFRIPLREILEKLRIEKKKAELEIPEPWRWRINPEFQADYGRLVEDVAAVVERRISSR